MYMENDIIKDICRDNNRDIVLKMANDIHWSDHITSLNKLKELDLFYERSVSVLPRSKKGSKCYLSYNNKIYAWLEVYSITKKANSVLIKMFPYINFVFPGLENNDFTEDFRYFFDNSHEQ